jgi:hypothetical protein
LSLDIDVLKVRSYEANVSEASSLIGHFAKGMWCKEDANGVVSCDFEECEIEYNDAPDKCQSEFEVQDILDRGYYEMIG